MNSSLLRNIADGYNHVMIDKRDPRVDGYFLMSSPWPTMLICVFYVYFVKSLGPRLMKDREPFELKKAIIVYNVIQVVFSIWIVYKGLVHAWLWRYNLRCQPIDYSDHPDELVVVQLCWCYFFCKLTELLDTVFFVLRKKFDQITHLHVIHHTIMPASVWWGVRFVPSGHGTFFGLLNTFVHIIMYTYYLMAAMGPKYQKYLWWKKHLTAIQMIQFICVFIHTAQLFFSDCDYPRVNVYIMCFNSVMFLGLFSNFYIQAYIKRRRLPKMRKEDEAVKNGKVPSSNDQANIHTIASSSNTIKSSNSSEDYMADIKKTITNFVTLASGVCTIDQNGLYSPDKAKKSFKKDS